MQDSGPGIAEKDVVHIFEPLYTTKSDGLDMGLAIVRTIVTAHGGAVGAENNPQGGRASISRCRFCPVAVGEQTVPSSEELRGRVAAGRPMVRKDPPIPLTVMPLFA